VPSAAVGAGACAERLTSLAVGSLLLAAPGEQLAGCLVAALPSLAELCVSQVDSAAALMAALRGHPRLARLQGRDLSREPEQWGAQLRSLAALTSLEWHVRSGTQQGAPPLAAADAALSACAAAQGLQQLSLDSRSAFSMQALQALAGGACTQLRRLSLNSRGVGLAAVAALFEGRLARLEALEVQLGLSRDARELKVQRAPWGAGLDTQQLQQLRAFAGANDLARAVAAAAKRVLPPVARQLANARCFWCRVMGRLDLLRALLGRVPREQRAALGLGAGELEQLLRGVAEGVRLRRQLEQLLWQSYGTQMKVKYRGCLITLTLHF
jgi:hypothetical protein